jgi:hypothetical protein
LSDTSITKIKFLDADYRKRLGDKNKKKEAVITEEYEKNDLLL